MTTMVDTLSAKFKADGYLIMLPSRQHEGIYFRGHEGQRPRGRVGQGTHGEGQRPKCPKFQDYLGLDVAAALTSGWMISASGFSNSALRTSRRRNPPISALGRFRAESELGLRSWYGCDSAAFRPLNRRRAKAKLRYFGYSRAKGVWGNDSGRHLAGAFALLGFDVVLVDLDPDKNLRKLFLQDPQDEDGDASLYVPAKGGGRGRRSRSSTTTSGTRRITRTSRSSSATALPSSRRTRRIW